MTAAFYLMLAGEAMREAAEAMDIVGGEEAALHAAEMRGAIKIARRWELEMRRQHSMPTTGNTACAEDGCDCETPNAGNQRRA